jgi:hypothetical protein
MKILISSMLLTIPFGLFAQFDGIVGTSGCKAIHCDDARIIEWAVSCEVTRGYLDIAKPHNGYVSFGTETNALGKPDEKDALNAVSLGDSGVAILTFQTPIVNGNGYDFAVFENALDDTFLELAFVEASSDGVHYFRFPATSNTPTDKQIGTFGKLDATLINNLAGKYRVGWGTPFDLDDLADNENLDKNNIRYIKLIDVIGSIDPQYASKDANGLIINDPYPTAFASGGFDLTGVGVIHNRNSVSVSAYDDFFVSVYPNPCKSVLYVHAKGCKLSIHNSIGQPLHQQILTENSSQIDMSGYADGVYFVYLCNGLSKKCLKVVKW